MEIFWATVNQYGEQLKTQNSEGGPRTWTEERPCFSGTKQLQQWIEVGNDLRRSVDNCKAFIYVNYTKRQSKLG